MNNKKGWLRIFEAFLAVIIIAGVLIVLVMNQRAHSDFDEGIQGFQRGVLFEIAENNNYRHQVLNNDATGVESFVGGRMIPGMEFSMKICGVEEICRIDGEYNKEVYVAEIIISSNLTLYEPKKLKIFMWES
ncbi:MAG: hypothetical protein ABIE22_05140 [archaeon]